MATINISVPDPMRDFVLRRIETGQYAGVSDYMRELIRRDQNMIEDEVRWLNTLDTSITASLAEMEAGGGTDLDTACQAALADITTANA